MTSALTLKNVDDESVNCSPTKIDIFDNSDIKFQAGCISISGEEECSSAAPINLKTYFSSFANDINQVFNNKLDFTCNPKRFSSIITCNKDAVVVPMDMPLKCAIHHLKVNEECPGFNAGERGMDLNLARKIPIAGVRNLESLQFLKSLGKMRTSHYRDKSWSMAALRGGEPDLLCLQELVLTIRVHQPYCIVEDDDKMNMYRPKPQQEFQVLGSQFLTELRDLITCPNHFIKAGEFSDNPHSHVKVPYAKDLYKSGYFFFENTFYNDMRDPSNIDYSEVIREWAKTNPSTSQINMECALMEETRFHDLTVRMGYPYLYQHLGDCEHLVIILNARLINKPNELSSKLYPMQRCPFRVSVRLCSLCGFYVARWITYKNKRMPHDPSYFCNNCMISYNYVDGKKVCNFIAYYYLEREPTDKDLKYTVEVEKKMEQPQLDDAIKRCRLFELPIPRRVLCDLTKKPPGKKSKGIDYSISNTSTVDPKTLDMTSKESNSIDSSEDNETSGQILANGSEKSNTDLDYESAVSTQSSPDVKRCKSKQSSQQAKYPHSSSEDLSDEALSSENEEEELSDIYEDSIMFTYTKDLPKNPDSDFYVDKYTEIGDEDSDEKSMTDESSSSDSEENVVIADDSNYEASLDESDIMSDED